MCNAYCIEPHSIMLVVAALLVVRAAAFLSFVATNQVNRIPAGLLPHWGLPFPIAGYTEPTPVWPSRLGLAGRSIGEALVGVAIATYQFPYVWPLAVEKQVGHVPWYVVLLGILCVAAAWVYDVKLRNGVTRDPIPQPIGWLVTLALVLIAVMFGVLNERLCA